LIPVESQLRRFAFVKDILINKTKEDDIFKVFYQKEVENVKWISIKNTMAAQYQ
jgi:hypothetical protein